MKNFILFLISTLIVGLVVKLFLIEIFTVPTDSMVPTIPVGKKVVVTKFFYTLEKNSIVAFEHNHENFVKRITGLPHDTLYISDFGFRISEDLKNPKSEIRNPKSAIVPQKNDEIILNAENLKFYQKLIEQNENVFITQLGEKIFIDGVETNKYIFKNNYYFVQGDNTANSIDSRSFGLIPEKNIFGKVLGF